MLNALFCLSSIFSLLPPAAALTVEAEQISASTTAARKMSLASAADLTFRMMVARAALAEIEVNARLLHVLGEKDRPVKLALTHGALDLALASWAYDLTRATQHTLSRADAEIVAGELRTLTREIQAMSDRMFGTLGRFNPESSAAVRAEVATDLDRLTVDMTGATITYPLSTARQLLVAGLGVAIITDAASTYAQIQLTPEQVDQKRDTLRAFVADADQKLNNFLRPEATPARGQTNP